MNKLLLKIACFCLHLVNRDKADDNAHWDDAQNYMERYGVNGLSDLSYKFCTLAQRAHERKIDKQDEIRIDTQRKYVHQSRKQTTPNGVWW